MRKIIGLLTFAQTIFCCYNSDAQNYSVYNSYYINPYLYNPAEAATEFTYIHLNHRQQWLGFEGAPKITTASFTTLFNETRTGLGVKISSFSRGILKTNDLSITYAYGVPLNPKNTFYFGLSGGAISNNIQLAEIDANDPAVNNYLENNLQPSANFGMLYRSVNGINLGVALPQLFSPKFNSIANFNEPSISPVDNVIVSAYYRRKVEGKLVSKKKRGVKAKVKTKETNAPLEFYALYKYAKAGNSQVEGTVKLNLSESFWIAALYRQAYGFAGSLGFQLSNFFQINYSYEPGTQPQPKFSTGTHEINLGFKIGDQKKLKRTAPVLRSTLSSATAQRHVARFEQSTEDPDHIQNDKSETKKYYVVVRSFADFTSADVYKAKLITQKFNADVFYYEKDKKYHVHVFESIKQGDANAEVKNLKTYTKLKDVRVLTVITPKK